MGNMNIVSYMILFTACLMGLQGSFAALSGCPGSLEWPERCTNRTYCFEKPEDYPSTQQIKEMIAKSMFNISYEDTIERRRRSVDVFEEKSCRQFHTVETIYMIKDANNSIRYVVQVPKLQQIVQIRECKPQIQLSQLLECQQEFTPMTFIVTSCDGKGVEAVSIRQGVPTSCTPSLTTDYYD